MAQFVSKSTSVEREDIYWGYFQPRTFFKSAMIIERIKMHLPRIACYGCFHYIVCLKQRSKQDKWTQTDHNKNDNNRHICITRTINAQRRQDQVQRKIFHWSVSVFSSSKERTVGNNDVKGSMATSRGLQSDVSPWKWCLPPWMGVFGKKPTLPSAVRSFAVLYIHISLLLSCMYIHSKMLWIQNLRKVLHSLPNWIWSINIIKDCTDCGRRGRWSSIFIWWTKRLFKARSLKTVEPQLFAPGPASLMVGGKNC